MLQGPVINHRRANKGESQAEVDAADWSHVIIGRLIPVWTSKTSKCPSRQTVRNLRYEEIQRDLLGHVTEQGGHSWPLLLNERCARYIAPITPPPSPRASVSAGWRGQKRVGTGAELRVSPRVCVCAPGRTLSRLSSSSSIQLLFISAAEQPEWWKSKHDRSDCRVTCFVGALCNWESRRAKTTHANICAFLGGWGVSSPIPCKSGPFQPPEPACFIK